MSVTNTVQEEKIALLRQELKTWEKAFAAANDGRKANRDDIKKDTAIAAKYREYDRLRRPETKRPEPRPRSVPLHVDRDTKPAPRQQQEQQPAATPQKRRTEFSLPSLPVVQSLADDDEADGIEMEPTPAAIRMQLGPTPQKDGHILSLFDSLHSVTPSKARSALSVIEGNIAATPSKSRNATIPGSPAPDETRHSRTPASSGKRFMLDAFATPLKRKRDDGDESHGTPSSSMKLLATPAFLKRSATMSIMDTLAEEAEHDDEILGLSQSTRQPPFKKKKGFIRSLSSIIQGMRRQEDDALDEQMDIMREMDDLDDMDSTADRREQSTTAPVAKVLVEDSQVVMPLGPDRAVESEESEDDDPNVQARKPWKKKGLKRQTKRVMMRPVKHKPQHVTTQDQPDSDADEQQEVITETQLGDTTRPSDYDDESDYGDTEANLQRMQSKETTNSSNKAAIPSKTDSEGPVKRAARMISAGAHANFRKLKIKNKNSKANGRGRFGRR